MSSTTLLPTGLPLVAFMARSAVALEILAMTRGLTPAEEAARGPCRQAGLAMLATIGVDDMALQKLVAKAGGVAELEARAAACLAPVAAAPSQAPAGRLPSPLDAMAAIGADTPMSAVSAGCPLDVLADEAAAQVMAGMELARRAAGSGGRVVALPVRHRPPADIPPDAA